MFEFKGIELSSKYITPETDKWLYRHEGICTLDYMNYDNGRAWIIWTYSSDEDGTGLPEDLARIIRVAYKMKWELVILTSDGADCDLFESYEKAWENFGMTHYTSVI